MSVDRTQRSRAGAREFRIRDLQPGDAAAVRSLVLAGLAEHWGDVDPSLNADLHDLAAAHPHGRTVVAVDIAGRVVGTGTVTPHAPEHAPERAPERAEIVRMSVAASWRGDGVGRAIVDELVATAERWGARRVVLETTATWTGTIAFYERCGFRATHVVDGDFGPDVWFERLLGDDR